MEERHAMKHSLTILALCLFTALECAAEPLELNARHFVAKGDGTTADTAAFLATIVDHALSDKPAPSDLPPLTDEEAGRVFQRQ
jgi:hypothetical protein